MKIKTTELEGAALDWAVARAEGDEPLKVGGIGLRYSSDWGVAGPIIERENIEVFMDDEKWAAYASHSLPQDFHGFTSNGYTFGRRYGGIHDEGSPLVAAMRCYVGSVFGKEVEVPEGLMENKDEH